MAQSITKFDDVIDLRDVIARIEELQDEREELMSKCGEKNSPETHDARMEVFGWDEENGDELSALLAFLEECKGNGGDEQYKGDWYPVTAVRDSYFKDYAQELADDIGAVKADAGWPNNCIDWDQAARELKMDYTGVEFDGVTYWVR